jgi:hypothetical protein
MFVHIPEPLRSIVHPERRNSQTIVTADVASVPAAAAMQQGDHLADMHFFQQLARTGLGRVAAVHPRHTETAPRVTLLFLLLLLPSMFCW